MAGSSVKQKLREYFLANMHTVVSSRELAEVAAPASEWARRVRELREEEGWPIRTHNDTTELKPGEYVLDGPPPDVFDESFSRTGISQKTRSEVLDRDGYTCQSCGRGPGDVDEVTGRRIQLQMGHIVDKALGGKDEPSNLRTLCRSCNQGAKNITPEKPSTVWLLAQVRRAGIQEQRAVFEFLSKKFSVS